MLCVLICFLSLVFYITEQGRRNDLNNKKSDVNSLISRSVSNSSDSVHCNPLRQSSVSSGFSCHIDDKLLEEQDNVPSVELNHPSSHPSWVHVFSKSSSTTSLRTQCAAAANLFVKSPKVLHRRSRHAKKKQQNTEQLLREVTVPPNQFTMTCKQIESKIIVFDGGEPNSPLIKPPASRVFTDYGKRVSYACVGPQPSRNSQNVRSHPPFPYHYLKVIGSLLCG